MHKRPRLPALSGQQPIGCSSASARDHIKSSSNGLGSPSRVVCSAREPHGTLGGSSDAEERGDDRRSRGRRNAPDSPSSITAGSLVTAGQRQVFGKAPSSQGCVPELSRPQSETSTAVPDSPSRRTSGSSSGSNANAEKRNRSSSNSHTFMDANRKLQELAPLDVSNTRAQSRNRSLARALSSGSLSDASNGSRAVSRAPSGSRTPPGIMRATSRDAGRESMHDQLESFAKTPAGFSDERSRLPGWLPLAQDPTSNGDFVQKTPSGSSEISSPLSPKSPPKKPDSKPDRAGRRPLGAHREIDGSTNGTVSPAGGPGGEEEESTLAKANSTSSLPSTSVAAQGSGIRALQTLQRIGTRADLAISQRSGTQRGPRHTLVSGSRDDSFLSTVSERSSISDTTVTESRTSFMEGGQIEVFSGESGKNDSRDSGILANFKQVDAILGEQIQQALRSQGWDKPLATQRRVVPLVMNAFRDEQKTFVTVQGAPHCGKTSALALGLLGGVGTEPGLRAVVLSTSTTGEMAKYFGMCSTAHPAVLECFESASRKVTFEGLPSDPESAVVSSDPLEDLRRLSSSLNSGAPTVIFGHPVRVLPLLREAPSLGMDLGDVQVLALDDAEETIRVGLMDEVCEVCTILRHFAKQRLRHIVLSQTLSREAQSMIRCLRSSLVQQQNLFGIRAHRTQARARSVNHYYAVAPRAKWPAMLAALHHALSLPSGIIFDDASTEARVQARTALRAAGVQASVWNALQEQGSGVHAAARDGASTTRGPSFHLMPSDLMVLKVDMPEVRCVLHFEVPRRELSIYGLRLMCLEQGANHDKKKSKASSRTGAGLSSRSLSVLFVEEDEVVRELEKTFSIRMQEVPTEMLVSR